MVFLCSPGCSAISWLDQAGLCLPNAEIKVCSSYAFKTLGAVTDSFSQLMEQNGDSWVACKHRPVDDQLLLIEYKDPQLNFMRGRKYPYFTPRPPSLLKHSKPNCTTSNWKSGRNSLCCLYIKLPVVCHFLVVYFLLKIIFSHNIFSSCLFPSFNSQILFTSLSIQHYSFSLS